MTIHALLERSPGVKVVVVDFPESIPVAYLSLKSLRPDLRIALPHLLATPLDTKWDVVCLHPDQLELVPGDAFDLVFNMSAFQEMELGVVNNYLRHAANWLKHQGVLISVNHRVSRHIKGKVISAWSMEGIAPVHDLTVPWHDAFARDYGCEMVLRVANCSPEGNANGEGSL